MIRKFLDLPLGTRFRYQDSQPDDVFSILSHLGDGQVVRWSGVDAGPHANPLCCAVCGPNEPKIEDLEVIVVG